MKQLPERLSGFIETLKTLDRQDRIQTLIDLAGGFQPVVASVARRPFSSDHRVPGCESEAYVWAVPSADGTLAFHFAVENPQGISAMALAAILQDSLSGAPLDEVSEVPSDLIYDIFGRELSMGKSLGLMGIVNMVKAAARQRLASGCADRVA